MSVDNEPGEAPAPAPSAEQAADLARLELDAAPVPGAPGAPGAPAKADELPPPGAFAVETAGLVLNIARPVALWLAPGLREAPAELWEPVGPELARLLEHIGMGDMEAAKNPWFRFAFAVMPLATIAVIHAPAKEEKQGRGDPPARLAGPDLSASAAPVVQGSREVVIGAPVQ